MTPLSRNAPAAGGPPLIALLVATLLLVLLADANMPRVVVESTTAASFGRR